MDVFAMLVFLFRELNNKITALGLIIFQQYSGIVISCNFFTEVQSQSCALGSSCLLAANAVKLLKYVLLFIISNAGTFIPYLQPDVSILPGQFHVNRFVAGRIFISIFQQV